MDTGNLTPRSNDTVTEMRFSGNFGQPDGFGSVFTAKVNTAGEACLTLEYGEGKQWSVMLTDSQRQALASMLGIYKPILFEHTTYQGK